MNQNDWITLGVLVAVLAVIAIGIARAFGAKAGAAQARLEALAVRLWNADGKNTVRHFGELTSDERRRALIAAKATKDLWGNAVPDAEATWLAASCALHARTTAPIPSATAREEAVALRLFNLTDFYGAPAAKFADIPERGSLYNGLVDWALIAREALKIHDELSADLLARVKADHASTLHTIESIAAAAAPQKSGGAA